MNRSIRALVAFAFLGGGALAFTPALAQNTPPTVKIKDGNRSGTAPFTTEFKAGGSFDPDGKIVNYRWNFRDGSAQVNGFAVNHTFDAAGTYRVRLTATDDDGAKRSAVAVVTVTEPSGGNTGGGNTGGGNTGGGNTGGGDTSRIKLPIEVLGGDGYTTSVSFELGSSNVDRLWVQCSRCGYRDGSINPRAKGSVKLNNGPWVDLDAATATVEGIESRMGGIDGGFWTARFTVPISGAVEGANTLTFRFNGTDGITNGYRIIDMNLLNSASQRQLQDQDFQEANPALFQPFSTAADHLTEGKNLWEGSKAILDKPGGRLIKAACADCHASDGRDLKYFNYSNRSIIARALFHGLSNSEGQAIASYIRELDAPAPDSARPWNPPYQPGPDLDSRPVEEWAAGAGLDAVLESDADMLPFLFPEGTSRPKLRAVINSKGTLNVREIPVAIQFPDWKAWLPEIHPMDIWPNDFENSTPMLRYEQSMTTINGAAASQINTNRLKTLLADINSSSRAYLRRGRTDTSNGGSAWRTSTGAQIDSRDSRYSLEEAKRSLAAWSAVKQWEIAHRSGIADEAPRAHPDGGEVRAWPGNGQSVHQMAPHITSENINNWTFQNPAVGDFFSTVWYQVQMTLNAGQRQSAHITPVDWPYQLRHIYQTSDRYREAREPLRLVQSLIKMYQNADNGMGTGYDGWQLRFTSPTWLYSMDRGNAGNTRYQDLMPTLIDYEAGLRNRITEAFLAEWLDVVDQFNTTSDWARSDNQGTACTRNNPRPTQLWYCVAPSNAVPQETVSGAGYDFAVSARPYHADHIYEVLPLFRNLGINSTTLDRLRDWGEDMWPAGDWNNR